MTEQQIRDLLERYQRGQCTPEEEETLRLWYNKQASRSEWNPDEQDELLGHRLKGRIDAELDQPVPTRLKWRKLSLAAIILLTIGVSIYFSQVQKSIETQSYRHALHDIDPGGTKAVLTLADGTKIALTDAPLGRLATESGITITKTVDGLLDYTVTTDGDNKDSHQTPGLQHNTITTPRGGRYRINLPDGTRVWLNSESSLKFPVSFINAKERNVQLDGEAYFEVSENKKQRFRVSGGNQVVEVQGTHFNVMAYPDESTVETTLLEGKISVAAGNKVENISPGQQLRLSGGKMEVVDGANLDGVIAWKNNLFQFDNTEIEKVLRQIERWYDVEIEYETIPDAHFTGVVPRNLKISTILNAMEENSKVKFEITGRRVRVINQNNDH